MKKITLFLFLIFSCFGFTQNTTSGTITLTAVPNRSVQFDVNNTSGTVTMTLKFPDNTYLAIGMSQGTENDIATGQGMGDLDDDCVVGRNSGIEDRNMPTGTGNPALDNISDLDDEWTVVSNTTNSGERTVVATRSRVAPDSEDTTFPSTAPFSMPIIYAYGGSSFSYHGFNNYGGTMASFVLSNEDFQLNPARFSISPNPPLVS